ncbi:MAG: hypothetical protein Q4A29_08925 [Eubacteriales bacterium]|nr:hypothetical protein [Eubacteriales bacterium]
MIIGFADITGKGHLTSQLCFVAGLFPQFSDKKHLIISRKPLKAEYYLGIEVEESEKKRNDIFRLAVNGQLSYQLLHDYSIALMKGLDYLDVSFIDEKEEYRKVLYEYILEKAEEGYQYIFMDMADCLEMQDLVDKVILCMPQSLINIQLAVKEREIHFEKSKLPLLLFAPYHPVTKWTRNRLAKEIPSGATLGIDFSYELFDAFTAGNLLNFLKRKYLLWEKEYRILSKFINSGEEKRR